MIAQRFAQSNTVMAAPPGMPDCYDLHVWTDGQRVLSAWRPSPEELVKINLGEPVWLWIFGCPMQPVALTVDDPFAVKEEELS